MTCRLFILTLLIVLSGCNGQSQLGDIILVGGPCEGCEAALEYKGDLSHSGHTSSFEGAERPWRIVGNVYKKDGISPASGVILYFYHTDNQGIYSAEEGATGWGRRHGKNRTWLKTNSEGNYEIYFDKPASYPNSTEPEHVHITVLEEGLTPYYIDSIEFLDDKLLTESHKKTLLGRGGIGIVTPVVGRYYTTGKRDIILGMNIPDYPTNR